MFPIKYRTSLSPQINTAHARCTCTRENWARTHPAGEGEQTDQIFRNTPQETVLLVVLHGACRAFAIVHAFLTKKEIIRGGRPNAPGLSSRLQCSTVEANQTIITTKSRFTNTQTTHVTVQPLAHAHSRPSTQTSHGANA